MLYGNLPIYIHSHEVSAKLSRLGVEDPIATENLFYGLHLQPPICIYAI
jgi:hypothetical protein